MTSRSGSRRAWAAGSDPLADLPPLAAAAHASLVLRASSLDPLAAPFGSPSEEDLGGRLTSPTLKPRTRTPLRRLRPAGGLQPRCLVGCGGAVVVRRVGLYSPAPPRHQDPPLRATVRYLLTQLECLLCLTVMASASWRAAGAGVAPPSQDDQSLPFWLENASTACRSLTSRRTAVSRQGASTAGARVTRNALVPCLAGEWASGDALQAARLDAGRCRRGVAIAMGRRRIQSPLAQPLRAGRLRCRGSVVHQLRTTLSLHPRASPPPLLLRTLSSLPMRTYTVAVLQTLTRRGHRRQVGGPVGARLRVRRG